MITYGQCGVDQSKPRGDVAAAQPGDTAHELVAPVPEDQVIRTQLRLQRPGDTDKQGIALRMPTGVVHELEAIDVYERHHQRRVRAQGSSDFLLQQCQAGVPQVGASQAVEGSEVALGGRRPTVGQGGLPVQLGALPLSESRNTVGDRALAVQLGPASLAGSFPTIGQRSVTIKFCMRSLACARSPTSGRARPILGGKSTRQIRPVACLVHVALGCHVALGRGIVPLGITRVARVRGSIPERGSTIPLITGLVPKVGGVVANQGGAVSFVAGLVTQGCDVVATIAGQVPPVGVAVPAIAHEAAPLRCRHGSSRAIGYCAVGHVGTII